MKHLKTVTILIILVNTLYGQNHKLLINGKIEYNNYKKSNPGVVYNELNTKKYRLPFSFSASKFRASEKSQGQKYGPFYNLEEAYNLFDYFIRNSNVEFGLSTFYDRCNNQIVSYISTSNDTTQNYGNSAIENQMLLQGNGLMLISSIHNHPNFKAIKKSYPSGCYSDCNCVIQSDCLYYHETKRQWSDNMIGPFYMIDLNSNSLFLYEVNTCEEVKTNNIELKVYELIRLKIEKINSR